MLKFSREHTWIDTDNGRIGISNYAQGNLGEIIYIELPEVGRLYGNEEQMGAVESAKSVSALFAPVALKVTEINPEVEDAPEILNSDPYGQGWIATVEITDQEQLDSLMSEDEYRADYQ